jgi:DNA polymerase-3 subunit epsilon
MRQIILDTETTGLRTEDGHRIIEIGCLEMIDRKLTGKQFHYYINPEREIEAGAIAVHGIKNEFLKDKPVFSNIVDEFMTFISGSELVIHNAPFDIGFLNHELKLHRQQWKTIADYCSVVDTLKIARDLHAGQRNSLDALCKRYFIDNSQRDLHGALLDAHLLAQVYLAMTGGQSSFFDTINSSQTTTNKNIESENVVPVAKHNLTVIKATIEELTEHEKYLQSIKQHGKCLWLDN